MTITEAVEKIKDFYSVENDIYEKDGDKKVLKLFNTILPDYNTDWFIGNSGYYYLRLGSKSWDGFATPYTSKKVIKLSEIEFDMEFKIGDKVRFVKSKDAIGPLSRDWADKYLTDGEIYTIRSFDVDGNPQLKDGKYSLNYNKYQFELVVEDKIIGYKAPFDLNEGAVKKGSVYKKGFDYRYYFNDGYGLPPEIVETWEPVYEKKETVLILGTPGVEITISKKGIFEKSTNFNVGNLKHILQGFPKNTALNGYNVSYNTVTIGCQKFEKEELEKIISIYESYVL